MTTNENAKYWWFEKGEKAKIRLIDLGTYEIYKGNRERVLGEKRFKHISSQALFGGRKVGMCHGGVGKCEHCTRGHKPSCSVVIPIIVDKNSYICEMQISLHKKLAEIVEGLVTQNVNPLSKEYFIQRPIEGGHGWVVSIADTIPLNEVSQPNTQEPISPFNPLADVMPQQSQKEDVTMTTEEKLEFAGLDHLIDQKGMIVSSDQWIDALVQQRGWDRTRTEKLVVRYVKNGRFKNE